MDESGDLSLEGARGSYLYPRAARPLIPNDSSAGHHLAVDVLRSKLLVLLPFGVLTRRQKLCRQAFASTWPVLCELSITPHLSSSCTLE